MELAAIGDPCIEAESYYVELAYATQPRAVALWEAHFDDNLRNTMTACLDRAGVSFDPDANSRELFEIAGELIFDLMDQGHSLEELDAAGLNCHYEVHKVGYELHEVAESLD